jgi:predicted acetyltransferase
MEELRLKNPTMEYKEQVIEYKQEFIDNNSDFDGCAGLNDTEDYDEWRTGKILDKKFGKDRSPSQVFLAVRKIDNTVVGMIDIRYKFNEITRKFGGNIGYSVRPSERCNGYASEMLKQMLLFLRDSELNKVLICCDPENTGSKRTIEKNGGVLESIVDDEPHFGKSGKIARYWIKIK